MTSDEIEIHLRLTQRNRRVSGIESLAIRVKNNNAPNGDILEINEIGDYYFNDPLRASANPTVTNVGGYAFSKTGQKFTINLFPSGHFIHVKYGSLRWGMSVAVKGHSSMFSDADGMCGDWDLSGIRDRDDNVVNGKMLGESWQVGLDSGDAQILSGDAPNTCVPALPLTQQQQDEGKSCTFCNTLATPHQRKNCKYDASVLGCDWVKDREEAPFYDKSYNENSMDFYHSEVIKKDQFSYTFPTDKTSQFVHGICVLGASGAQATSTDNALKYTEVRDFGTGTKLWDDRLYVARDVDGSAMCEGGTYLRPNRHKVSSSGNSK